MPVNFVNRNISEPQAFKCFYEQYASKLWGLILSAKLPAYESETILVQTFSKAWLHPHRQEVGEKGLFTWLLSLAYAEGLPPLSAKSVFNR